MDRSHAWPSAVFGMKLLQAVLAISAFAFARGAEENYEKEKVCEGLRKQGKDKFKAVVTVLYAQKFANGTFEEVTAVADYMLKLAEQCCSKDASPDCYNKGANVLAEMSCGKDSPFPKHPDLPKCCVEKDDKRRLCLASLRCSTEEPPSLYELTHEEICKDFKQDEKLFAARFTYEFSRRYRTVPVGLLLKATENHVQMAEKCCSPTAPQNCFLVQRLQHKDFNVFLRYASSVCQNARYLKDHSAALTVYFASLLKLNFEDALSLSRSLHNGLAKCCWEETPQCLVQKLTAFHKTLCNHSLPGEKSNEFQRCCGKAALDSLSCVDTLERHGQLFLGAEQPPPSDLCGTAGHEALQRFLFEVGAKHPSVSMSTFASISEITRQTQERCCGSANVTACLESGVSAAKTLLSKTDDLCSKYAKLDFTEFRKAVLADTKSKEPTLSKEEAEAKAEGSIDFSLSCCSQYAPARKCRRLVEEMAAH